MRSNSSGVRPCSATSSGVTVGSTIDLVIDSGTLTKAQSDTTRTFGYRIIFGYPKSNLNKHAFSEASIKRKGTKMKRTIIGLACALIAPLAFAQTSTTTTTEQTTSVPTTTTETTTTYSAGTVTTYEPGKTIVVKSPEGPVSFALGTAARVVDGAGKIVTAPLRAGQKVRVYYTGPTERRTVERVVVED
jgi:hypothetical protein